MGTAEDSCCAVEGRGAPYFLSDTQVKDVFTPPEN